MPVSSEKAKVIAAAAKSAGWLEKQVAGSPYAPSVSRPDEVLMDAEDGCADPRQEGRRESLDFFLRWAFQGGHGAERIGKRVQRLALDLGRFDLLPIRDAKALGKLNGETKQATSKRGRETRKLFGGKTPMQRSDEACESSRKAAKKAWKRSKDL